MPTSAEKDQERYRQLALQHGIRILSKKRLTPKDYRRLEKLTKIAFDVNAFQNQVLVDRLSRSRSCVPAYRDQPSQQRSEESSTD